MRTFKKLEKLNTQPVDTRTEEQKNIAALLQKKIEQIARKKEEDTESKRRYLAHRRT